jgi:hypothetical protein
MSVIIECRNKTADIKHRNGDWETILGENITINPNDQLYVKNSFIDTQLSTNEKINVEEDIGVEIKYGFYNIINNGYGLSKWTGGQVDLSYKPTVLGYRETIPDPDPENRNFLNNCSSESADGLNPTKPVPRVTFSYLDINGDQQIIVLPKFGVIPNDTKFKIPELNGLIVRDTGTFTPSLTDLEKDFNLKLTPTYTNLLGVDVVAPVILNRSISIKAGTYDPDFLCEAINLGMTNNTEESQFFQFTIDSPLNSTGNIQNNIYGDLNGPQKNKLYYVPIAKGDTAILEPDVSANYASPPTADDLFTGASQVELSYNQSTKRFEWSYLHTPFYYTSQPAVQIFRSGLNNDVFKIGSQSGIFIASLNALNGNGDPTNFWSLLGFDALQTPKLIPEIEYENINNDPKGGGVILVPRVPLQVGVNITSGLITSDSCVDKSNPLKPFNTNPTNSTVNVNQTELIEAGISVLDNEDKFGYFIIEIGHKLKNDFYTQENNYRNFQQIVSRYFVQNSYTSGTSDGSLIYTHEGEPTLLQSFRCRILNSDKILANNVGDDNTVHLVLVRAPQPQQIPKQIKDKKEEEKK